MVGICIFFSYYVFIKVFVLSDFVNRLIFDFVFDFDDYFIVDFVSYFAHKLFINDFVDDFVLIFF